METMHIAPDIVHCIGWVALSSLCFRPYKWYIFCDDMILATCHSHRILIWWSSYHHTAQKIYSWKEGNSRTSTIILWFLSNDDHHSTYYISPWSTNNLHVYGSLLNLSTLSFAQWNGSLVIIIIDVTKRIKSLSLKVE